MIYFTIQLYHKFHKYEFINKMCIIFSSLSDSRHIANICYIKRLMKNAWMNMKVLLYDKFLEIHFCFTYKIYQYNGFTLTRILFQVYKSKTCDESLDSCNKIAKYGLII